MRFCQTHWDALRKEIDDVGLGSLVADTHEQAAKNVADQLTTGGPNVDNFEPLMTACIRILEQLFQVDPSILILDGCPLCYANGCHALACEIEGCDYTYDAWLHNAAEEQATWWKAMQS